MGECLACKKDYGVMIEIPGKKDKPTIYVCSDCYEKLQAVIAEQLDRNRTLAGAI